MSTFTSTGTVKVRWRPANGGNVEVFFTPDSDHSIRYDGSSYAVFIDACKGADDACMRAIEACKGAVDEAYQKVVKACDGATNARKTMADACKGAVAACRKEIDEVCNNVVGACEGPDDVCKKASRMPAFVSKYDPKKSECIRLTTERKCQPFFDALIRAAEKQSKVKVEVKKYNGGLKLVGITVPAP